MNKWDRNNIITFINNTGKYNFIDFIEYNGIYSMVKIKCVKNKFCKDNNIKLIRIPYWEYDNIEKILIKELDLI